MINSAILYLGLGLGAIGVALALPRRRVSPQLLGAIVAAVAFGAIFFALGWTAYGAGQGPNYHFYVFAFIALGSALRVISHPRPVYAALYFILTILSSAALYVIAGAEFMAFALIIIYAGAILITYLFVIMLATQAPSEEEIGALTEYDHFAREPVAATCAGFVLLAVISGMLAQGINEIEPASSERESQALLEMLPGKVEGALERRGLRGFEIGGDSSIDADARTAVISVTDGARFDATRDHGRAAELDMREWGDGQWLVVLPADVTVDNIDNVGFSLVGEHPMALELAGVILLMALLGAVVLARKQIEIGEAEKAVQAGGAP